MKFCLNKTFVRCLALSLFFLFSNSISWAANNSPQNQISNNYDFTTDWFTHHASLFKAVLTAYENKENIHYLEIGVFEGRSLIWMLENILTHPTAKATGIDIFPNDIIHKRCLNNIKMSGFADKVVLIKGKSQNKLKNIPFHSIDIVYIDGEHTAPGVLTDAILSWPLVKKGGIIIFDDYHFKEGTFKPWNNEYGRVVSPQRRPKIAIDAFIDNFRDYIEVVNAGWLYVIQKQKTIYWER